MSFVVALAFGSGPPARADDVSLVGMKSGEHVLYAGHQVVIGHREIPILGRIETRTDTFLIAEVVRSGDTWVVSPKTCRVKMASAAGVDVSIAPSSARALPIVPFRLTPGPDGYWYAAPWQAGWGSEDVDGDGHPGATFSVHAPLCSGSIYIASTSWSRARVRPGADRFDGEIRVVVHQRTLGASSTCLTLMGTDGRDRVSGNFSYVEVPAGTTCDALEHEGWPVHARAPAG